jgi:tRNA modification GTPase
VACLTPPGVAALATVALRGPAAWELVRELFRPHSAAADLPDVPERGRIWFGRFGSELADDVVLTVKRAAPAPWVELHCHGGREVVRLLLELFAARGARTCPWQQLERLTDDDPWRAAAAAALAEAPTARTAAILLDQYHGAFRRATESARAALERGDVNEARRVLSEPARYADLGRHLTSPWRVAVAGAPNVGKSSLVNALAGYQRSVVAPTPGTTRDVVTTLLAVDGWPVELADTAGLRTGTEALEEEGIRLAHGAAAVADLCLWVLDASVAPAWPSGAAANVRLVVNKVDLPAAWDLRQVGDAVAVSAKTGAGLAELCLALGHWLVPDPPPPGAAVPFTGRLAGQVDEALQALTAERVEEARRALGADLV